MRVSLFTPTARRCGVADYARSLRPHLLRHCGVTLVAADAHRDGTDFEALGRAANDADVAHVQYEHAFFCENDVPAENFARFARQITIPIVLTMHCPPLDDARWRPVLDRADAAWIAHAASVADALEARATRGVIDQTPLPAAHGRPAGEAPLSAFREAHDLAERRVVTIFGFTKRHKGYALAVDALSQLPNDVVLLVAGGPQDGRDEAALADVRARAAARGVAERLRVTGYLDGGDVPVALHASDVILAPFEHAHGSASLATALGCEGAVVASAIPSFVDIETRFGCLALFPPGDAPALAGTIREVLSDGDHRRRLTAGARRYHQAHGFAALAQRLHEHGERLLGGRARAAGAA